jgi:thymidylate synthase
MKLTQINAKTLPEAWFLCIKGLVDSLDHTHDGIHKYRVAKGGSFADIQRIEYDYINIHIEYPYSLPMIPDVPQGIPAPTTMEYINSYLPYLMTSSINKNETYTYGQYLEPQISKVINMYKSVGPNTNQAYMTVGDKESINQSEPPCLRGIDTRIDDDSLHFMVYFRSWDLWGGFPSNLAAIQILKEYMALEIGVADGELIATSKGLHLYDHCWELAKNVVRR